MWVRARACGNDRWTRVSSSVHSVHVAFELSSVQSGYVTLSCGWLSISAIWLCDWKSTF